MASTATDVSALLDVASIPEPTTSTTSSPSTETVDQSTETVSPETTPELTEETLDEQPSVESQEDEKDIDARTNPAEIRAALKRFRDSAPENAKISREINNGYGRYLAYKDAFPTVADARSAKAAFEAVGGHDGLASLQETIKSVNETDGLLFNGDPRVIKNIVEDMRREGKLDSFGKLASPFLDELRQVDEKAYFAALKPHFFQGLVNVNFPGMIQGLAKALTGDKPDVEYAKTLIGEFSNWFDNLRNGVESSAKAGLDPERQKFEQERTQWESQRADTVKNEIANVNVTNTLKTLGTELKPFLKLPYFKNFGDPQKKDIARGLYDSALAELKQDKQYQSQINAFFSQKTINSAAVQKYHQDKIAAIAPRVVKDLIETRYPGYARSGKPAPKPGAAGARPAAGQQQAQPGKPQFVTQKPDWNNIDFDKDPNKLLFITGRAYLKNGKFVTWSPKYK